MAKRSKARVLLADRAIAELQEIETYTIGKWGEAQAAKYLDAFDRFFSLVEAEPGILRPDHGSESRSASPRLASAVMGPRRPKDRAA